MKHHTESLSLRIGDLKEICLAPSKTSKCTSSSFISKFSFWHFLFFVLSYLDLGHLQTELNLKIMLGVTLLAVRVRPMVNKVHLHEGSLKNLTKKIASDVTFILGLWSLSHCINRTIISKCKFKIPLPQSMLCVIWYISVLYTIQQLQNVDLKYYMQTLVNRKSMYSINSARQNLLKYSKLIWDLDPDIMSSCTHSNKIPLKRDASDPAGYSDTSGLDWNLCIV